MKVSYGGKGYAFSWRYLHYGALVLSIIGSDDEEVFLQGDEAYTLLDAIDACETKTTLDYLLGEYF